MPKKVERKLFREAKSRGYGKERTNEFVFGTLRKRFGWRPRKRRK